MEVYDIVMLVILFVAIVFGAIKGLAWQIAWIASLVISYFVAMNFFPQVAPYISAQDPWNKYAGMLILYLGTSLVIWILFGIVRRQLDNLKLNGFDRQAGALLGAVTGVILCVVVTMFAVGLMTPTQRQVIVNSRSGYYVAQVIEHSKSIFPESIQATINPFIEQFHQKLNEKTDPNSGPRDTQNNTGLNAGLELLKQQNPQNAKTIDQLQNSDLGKQLINGIGQQLQNRLNGSGTQTSGQADGNGQTQNGFFPTTLDNYQGSKR